MEPLVHTQCAPGVHLGLLLAATGAHSMCVPGAHSGILCGYIIDSILCLYVLVHSRVTGINLGYPWRNGWLLLGNPDLTAVTLC